MKKRFYTVEEETRPLTGPKTLAVCLVCLALSVLAWVVLV